MSITTSRSNPLGSRGRNGTQSSLSGFTNGDPESPNKRGVKKKGKRGAKTRTEGVSSEEPGHSEGEEEETGSSGGTRVEIGGKEGDGPSTRDVGSTRGAVEKEVAEGETGPFAAPREAGRSLGLRKMMSSSD